MWNDIPALHMGTFRHLATLSCAECVEVRCPVLVVTNGHVKGNCSGSIGDTCEYDSCETGFELTEVGSLSRVCQASGEWSGVPKACVEGACEDFTCAGYTRLASFRIAVDVNVLSYLVSTEVGDFRPRVQVQLQVSGRDTEFEIVSEFGDLTELGVFTGLDKHTGWDGKHRLELVQSDPFNPTMAIHKDDSLVLRVVVQKSEDPEDLSLLGTVDLLGANLIAMHPNDNPLGIPMTTLQSDAARFTLAVSGSRPCAWRCGEITLRSDYTSQEGWLVASMFAGGGSSRTAGPDTYYRGMAFESAFTVTSAEGNEGDGGSIVLIVASELEAKTFLAKQLAGRELFRAGGSPASVLAQTGCAVSTQNVEMFNCVWSADANLPDCPVMALAKLGSVTADVCRSVGCCYDQGRCFTKNRVNIPRCPSEFLSSRKMLSFNSANKEGLVISDSASATGLDSSFSLAADVSFSAPIGKRQLIFSTMPLDPVEVEKINTAADGPEFYQDLLSRTVIAFVENSTAGPVIGFGMSNTTVFSNTSLARIVVGEVNNYVFRFSEEEQTMSILFNGARCACGARGAVWATGCARGGWRALPGPWGAKVHTARGASGRREGLAEDSAPRG
jgi:hypothetical protein